MARRSIERGISYDDQKKLYYVTLSRGTDANGKSTKEYKTATSKDEARRIRREHLKSKQRGEVLPLVTDTLVEYVERHIQYKSLTCAKSTIYGYSNILNNYIKPYFKEQKIQKITANDIEKYIIYLDKRALGNNTIKKHTDLLFSVFESALKKKVVQDNPLRLIDRIKPQKNEKNCYNIREAQQLLQTVRGTLIETPVYLAVFLGLRRGEIAGLKWEHIDFDERTLHVVNSRTQVGKDYIEKRPKTEKSIRKLPLLDPLYTLLLTERDRTFIKHSLKDRQIISDYVVRMPDGRPIRPNYISDRFNKIITDAGLKHITFHDLRHSYTSIAAAAGADLYAISSSLGHANVGVTSGVYLHELDTVKREAAEKVAKALATASSK